jgi:PncC family amidohydrolase
LFPLEEDELARAVGARLLALDARLTVVETTAGGLICARLLSVPGASRWFERGYIAYTRQAKLDISEQVGAVLAEHGAVSPETVAALAEGARARSGAKYALAESGIAGPQDGRRSAKPAGTAVIAVTSVAGVRVEEHVFPGSRVEVMSQIADRCLELLRETLEE